MVRLRVWARMHGFCPPEVYNLVQFLKISLCWCSFSKFIISLRCRRFILDFELLWPCWGGLCDYKYQNPTEKSSVEVPRTWMWCLVVQMKKKKIQKLPLHTRPQVPSSAPLFVLAPQRPAAETWVSLNPMPGGAIDLGPFSKGFELPDTHLLAALTKETGARSLSLGINPHVPVCREKGRFIPPSGAFTTNNSQVAARSLFR